jgi:hypothetical protein
MSGIGWKLRRLRAMSLGEILHRARIALRSKLSPPAYEEWKPQEAYERLFSGEADRLDSLIASLPPCPPETLAEADALLKGRWRYFGNDVAIGDPPRWNANPVTGEEWPDLPAGEIDYRRIDIAGGAKYAWEPGRLTFLPSLALAYRSTGREEFRETCLRWMADFAQKNPLSHGIQQTSGIEMALRVMTCGFALAILGSGGRPSTPQPPPPPEREEGVLGLMAQMALHCADNLSLGSSANNHLLAELAGMVFMGAMFPSMTGSAAPPRQLGEEGGRSQSGAGPAPMKRSGRRAGSASIKSAGGMLDEGLRRLQAEVLRQINPDGTSVEQSFGYVPFIWELLLYPLIAAERAGQTVEPVVKARLRASLEFARALRLPNGTLPQVGDEDDGRILFPADGPTRLDLVGNALASWLGAPALSPSADTVAILLTGRSLPAEAADDGCCEFPDGGYTVWRDSGLLLTFDHGPLGWGPLAAHGHADALAITLFNNGDPVFVDPGVFAYHEDPEARDRFRSTPYHSTVNFEGRSQSEMLGPFLWGKRATVSPASPWLAGEGGAGPWSSYQVRWATGEIHRRAVRLADRVIEIRDHVSASGAELSFALHPSASVHLEGGAAIVEVGGSQIRVECKGAGPWRIEDGEYSPRIGHKEPTKRLAATFEGKDADTKISLRATSG